MFTLEYIRENMVEIHAFYREVMAGSQNANSQKQDQEFIKCDCMSFGM